MEKFTEKIMLLIEEGEIERAFKEAKELARITKKHLPELVAIQSRYSVWKKDKNKGILDANNKIQINLVVSSFLELLSEIEKDVINDNPWIEKHKPHIEGAFEFADHTISLFKGFDLGGVDFDGLELKRIEHKIDSFYHYIIHWKITTELSFEENKLQDTSFYEKLKEECRLWPAVKNDGVIKKIIDFLSTELRLYFMIEKFPAFNIRIIPRVLVADGRQFFIMISSAMYPSGGDLGYPWSSDELLF